MSIKVITHRRRLLHKNAYHSPRERNRRNNRSLSKTRLNNLNKKYPNKCNKTKVNNKVNKSSSKKKSKSKKPKVDGLRMPYRFKYYQFQDYIFKEQSANQLSKDLDK